MLVSHIIGQKGATVESAGPDDTIADVVKRLSELKVGALPVVRDGKLSGIISERDIVRRLAGEGAELLAMKVAEIKTRDVITCKPDDGVSTVLARMTDGRFRHMPVLDNGEMIGIVSIGDIVKARLQEQAQEAAAMRDYIRAG